MTMSSGKNDYGTKAYQIFANQNEYLLSTSQCMKARAVGKE